MRTVNTLSKAHIYLVIAAIYGLAAVVLGAMGSHTLDLEKGTKLYVLFEQALLYMMIHSLLLIWLSSHLQDSFWIRSAALVLTVGVLLFCGGLLLLVFVGQTIFSWLTPVGGSFIILAWLNLVIHGFQKIRSKPQ